MHLCTLTWLQVGNMQNAPNLICYYLLSSPNPSCSCHLAKLFESRKPSGIGHRVWVTESWTQVNKIISSLFRHVPLLPSRTSTPWTCTIVGSRTSRSPLSTDSKVSGFSGSLAMLLALLLPHRCSTTRITTRTITTTERWWTLNIKQQ